VLAVTAVTAACGSHPTKAGRPSAAGGSGQPTPPPKEPVRTVTSPAREVDSGVRSRPLVALTFHGQGDPGLATDVLAAAEHARARLTVFAVGSWLAAQPGMVHRIGAGGHELANHTMHHRPMAGMGAPEAYAEFADCANLLRRLGGAPGHWVRPSGTPHTTAALRAAAGRAGYRVCVGYDVDSLDYTDPGPTAIRRRVAQARAGSIVSLHLGHAGTVTALTGILADLALRGLRPVTVTELLGAP